MDELETLTALNALYIRSVVNADADQFEKILADDFLCSNPDASLVDRQEFLRRTRASKPLQFMNTDDVQIRVLGDVAIIHAHTMFATAEGVTGEGRYTDIWSKQEGQWLAVSAHVTRLWKRTPNISHWQPPTGITQDPSATSTSVCPAECKWIWRNAGRRLPMADVGGHVSWAVLNETASV